MTTLIPELEHELRLAHRRVDQAVASTRPPAAQASTRLRVGLRPSFPVVAVLAAFLSVTAGAYASRGLWMPELGADAYGHATATAEAPPTSETSVLGVLRREPTAADRDPAVRGVLRGAGPSSGKIRTNAVRRLGTLPDGRVAVLVPARVPRGFDPTLPNMTQNQLFLALYDPATDAMSGFLSSDALGMRAGNLMWPISERLTPPQRTHSEAFLQHEVAAGRLRKYPAPPYYGVMSVEQTQRYDAAVGITGRDPVVYIGVVPDGVARVQVDGHVTVPVKDNFFMAPSTVGSTQPIQWLDEHGRLVPFASTLGAWK